MLRLCLLLAIGAGLLAPPHAPLAPSITWTPDWLAAFERATAESRVVFLAVNMDGEKANDVLAQKTYGDKTLLALSERTVNVIASRFNHAAAGKECSRFAGVRCADHQKADIRARESVLKAGLGGEVVAPQHVWLDGAGKVLLSVAYEVSAEELAWCFVTAIRRLDPESDVKMPPGAKAPRRLVVDGVAGGEDAVRPLTEEELEETLAALKKVLWGRERVDLIVKLLATDHPDAVDAIRDELKGVGLRGGGRRDDATGLLGALQEMRRALVHRIGVVSPPSFWRAVVEVIEDEDARMRSEVAAALEQLAAPEALKDVKKALGAEKDAQVEREFLRALASCGRADAATRKKLLGELKSKSVELRRNALYGLGLHAGDEEAARALAIACASSDPLDRQAALLGLAGAGAVAQRPLTEAAAADATAEEETRDLAARVLAVLDASAPLAGLGDDVVRVCGDSVRRERFYPAAPAQGGGGDTDAGE